MDWLNAENILGTAGVLATVAVLAYERLIPGLRRIGYRVQMDTAIGDDPMNDQAGARLGLFDETPEMSDASLVLLRIENDGLKSIGQTSYETDGLTVTFASRTVMAVAVTEPKPDHLITSLTPELGFRHEGNKIHLPKVPLNKGHHFKLLVLLTGSGVGANVTLGGTINEGSIKRNRQHRRPSNLLLGLLTFLVLLVGVQQTLLWRDDDAPPPIGCAHGELTVVGSTAFAPAMREIGDAYERDCPGSAIEVRAEGSTEGLRTLRAAGEKARDGAPAMIAMSDGRADGPVDGGPTGGTDGRAEGNTGNTVDGVERLKPSPVGVTVFALVLHQDTGVSDLTTEQVRALYRGDISNWKELGGHDQEVRLVSRTANSGTRAVFQRALLGADQHEPAVTSQDCANKDYRSAKVVRCERNSTEQVLRTVAGTEGALGYAEAEAARGTRGIRLLRLDGEEASRSGVERGRYRFRTVEYAYTYGRPPADSLASEFLGYLADGAAQNILRTHGHLSCSGVLSEEIC